MKRIIFTKRFADWHACLEGEPGVWGCGKSIDEAIGSLVRAHPERFGLSGVAQGTDYQADGKARVP